MKHPLQALLLDNNNVMVENTLASVKQISIREGDRDYRIGQLILCNPDNNFCVMADIVEVRKCKLSEVTQEEWEADGFVSQEDLLTGMRIFYPDITLESTVTIIRWENVRGFLVDRYLEGELIFND